MKGKRKLKKILEIDEIAENAETTFSSLSPPIHPINGEYIREWLVLGPFFPDDLETDFLAGVGGEANIQPQEGDTVTASDGRTLKWKRYKSKTDIIELLYAVGEHENATAYAFCILQIPLPPFPKGEETAGDVQIRLGSDDGVAVWINGQQVHHNPVNRSLTLDEDVFEVSLKAGDNRCLVKVFNETGTWDLAMRMALLPPNRAVLSGMITDETGKPIPDAEVSLEQACLRAVGLSATWVECESGAGLSRFGTKWRTVSKPSKPSIETKKRIETKRRDGKEIARTQTDTSGSYQINIYPVHGTYDLSATSGALGDWQLGIRLSEGERRKLNFTLKKAISIEGTLMMLDDVTPHATVPVQAICNGKVMATTLSDEGGKYSFINLKPGRYQVRCHILDGYVYFNRQLTIDNRQLKNIDFRFAPFKKGTWKNYGTLDGLAYNVVTKISCDQNGVMWFATEGGGVSRYDGKEFLNLTTKDGLAHNVVNNIYCDPDGVMWFATDDGGVSRYDGKEFVNLTTEDGLAGDTVWGIYRDPAGVMWFGIYDGGVCRYDGKEFKTFTTKDGLADNHVISMHVDPDGMMWFGTIGGGVSRYDGKEFVNLTTKDGLLNNQVRAIYRDPDGVMWFGTGDWVKGKAGGVSRYDGNQFKNFTTKDGLAGDMVWDIYRDPDGVMWFGTEGGVSRYDGKTFVNFTTEDGLANNQVHAIYRDPDGVMWFGTGHVREFERGGVSRYDESMFISLTTKDGLVHGNIVDIHRDAGGVMWFGAFGGGVSRYDGKEFVNLTIKDGLLTERIMALHSEPGGVMWFGGYGGVSRYDEREFINFTAKDGLAGRGVLTIYRDADDVMWFGTQGGGASWYNGEEFVNITFPIDDVSGTRVLAIYRDPDGVMWFGTEGRYGEGGFYRYDGKRFVRFTTEDGLADNTILSIYRDPDGFLWLGTWGGISRGVYPEGSRRDGKKFLNFTAKDGLTHDKVLAIHRDPNGVMWFGTDGGGVYCYDGTAWSSLDTRDGLAGETVSSIHQDSDGTFWFGTEGGITLYRPGASIPKVHIVSVTADQTYRDLSSIPAFIPKTRITIEYSAIDFKTVPEKRQYRCRIREIDKDWHPRILANSATKATSFDYTFDKPGTYTFEVQAIDRDLNYSEPVTLNLTVQPDPKLVSLQTQLNHLRREVGGKYHFEKIIGRSAGIKQLRALMEKAIDSGLTVLITGETGTGKELVAKAIHYNSPRKGCPLLDQNCGAIPKDLVASTLFGHRKGTFTGANEDKMGLFETASGGTVLLDEISEMPQDAQIHLLRVLEERRVQRLGEHISRDVDVRIIAMTNRDLVKEVQSGRFREDLYYRLSEFPIYIPPLRERVEDIPILAEHFLQEIDKELDGFAPDVFEMLQSYAWPGNVRELRNVIRRAAAFVEEGPALGDADPVPKNHGTGFLRKNRDLRIHTYHFPSQITHGESLIQEILSEQAGLAASVELLQRRLIEDALRECDGNRSQAARMLGVHRPNFIRLMKRLGIE